MSSIKKFINLFQILANLLRLKISQGGHTTFQQHSTLQITLRDHPVTSRTMAGQWPIQLPIGKSTAKAFFLKAHLHPNGLATVCYCFQTVLLFFSRYDWFSRLFLLARKSSCMFKTNRNSQLAAIYFAKLHQSTSLLSSMKGIYSPRHWNYLQFAM